MRGVERAFLDTNVLVYLFSADPAKADRAEALLTAGGTISVQVLNEFTAVARRKLVMDWDDIGDVLTVFRETLAVVPLDLATHERGLAIARSTGYAIYDALILASATEAGATRLWSEDMTDGQVVDGVEISNPFRD